MFYISQDNKRQQILTKALPKQTWLDQHLPSQTGLNQIWPYKIKLNCSNPTLPNLAEPTKNNNQNQTKYGFS